ncbi:hypothetical protein DIY07_09570 [Streptococcus iniae]|uniref:Uncharacterized protein n=1 Tax=Streptococcus iniae TaxID=1346 RepID=A0A3L8GCJ9_STRIN|nr:hypothetical protein [Streptococcus iniae]RLU51747.1 hypothetical protein DIY09_09465 [Streptococcus iniae]RLU54870.1 hypothetical protein DIY07_09570 [Streptococcus iniae]
MFRIQNQSDGKEQEFQNLAALLYALEGEEKRCLQLNTSASFYLFHLDKNEEVLESTEITIPSQEDKEIKELIGDFGLKGETKKFFWQRLTNKTPIPVKTSPNNHQESPSKTGVSTLLKRLIWWFPVLLSLASVYLSLETLQLVKTQPQVTPKVETVVTNQKADIFCRYFISSYFSQSPNLEVYLAEKLSKEDFKINKATPVSVLLENQEIKGNTTLVTYVVNVKETQDHVSSKRLTLAVRADKKAQYGYLVIKKPRLTAYP